jgi:NitT/TauT family transport system substrate-binding protein
MRRFLSITFMTTLLAALALTACASATPPSEVTVRVGVLPILDALPMYVAQAQGYFRDQAINVEFIPVSSAAERDQLMQAGQIDSMINDLVSTMLYNKDETQIVIVHFARTATHEYPQYRVLAAADSGIGSVQDLANVPIGVSEGTVIAYTTDRLLEGAGLAPDDIVTLAVPKIPDRMALLGSGELQAANLPDPLASLAMQAGATVVIDDTSNPDIGNSVISFDTGFLDAHPDAVRGFLAAVEKATADINADKQRWGDLLSEQSLVPEPLLGSYTIPDFPLSGVPTQAQFDDVLSWVQDEGLVEGDVSYQASVDGTYLP